MMKFYIIGCVGVGIKRPFTQKANGIIHCSYANIHITTSPK